jgi:hypothetical protein
MIDHQNESIFNAAEADSPIAGHISGTALKFSVAAFQDGVDPSSPFNGANAITQFNLTAFTPYTLDYIQP